MATNQWALDPAHSEIEFKVKHMMITNVKGTFNNINASIAGEDFSTSPIAVTIDAASIDTNNNDRDKHLKAEDFFDVAKYPNITFNGKSFEKKSDGEYKLIGDLTIKDITKEIALEVEYSGTNKDPWGNEKSGFNVSGKINRKDFGLNWNAALETGGVMVSEEVKIAAEMQFVKQAG